MANGTQFGFPPDPTKVKPGDSIYYNRNTGPQSPNVLSLLMQNAAKPKLDNTGNQIGLDVTKPYVDYNTIRKTAAKNQPFTSQFAQPGTASSVGPAPQQMQQGQQTQAQPEQQQIQTQMGENNNTAAQRMGFANANEARAQGVVFSDAVQGLNPAIADTVTPQQAQEAETIATNVQSSNPNTAVTANDVIAADNIGLNLQEIVDAYVNTDTDISDVAKQSLLDAQQQSLDRIEKLYQAELANITAEFGQAKQETKDIAGRTGGSLQRILGRAGGFTTSAGGQAIAAHQSSLAQQLDKLTQAEARAKASAAAQAESSTGTVSKETQQELRQLQQDIVTNRNSQARLMLDFLQEQRLSEKEDAVDPFFTGANVVSLMKSIPVGTSQELTDPNTGNTFTITGLADPNTISATGDDGTVRIINKDTGEIISQTSAGVGKTKTQAANVSITTRREVGGLIAAASDVLEADRGIDGRVNPATYEKQLNLFTRSQGGTAEDFKDLFPPELFLNTNNPDSIKFFQRTSDVLEGTGSLSNESLAG